MTSSTDHNLLARLREADLRFPTLRYPTASWLLTMITDDSLLPHLVHYSAALDRVSHTPPDRFCLYQPKSPSDCVWMVPGTERNL